MVYIIIIILCIIIIIYFKHIKIKTIKIGRDITSKVKWIGITAASDNHFNVSINLVLSFFLTHPNNVLVYYDMNLDKNNKKKLKQYYSLIVKYIICNSFHGKLILKVFNFSKYPSHFSLVTCIWKTIMIYEILLKYHKMIFWFDAGAEITGSLKSETDIAEKYGFYMQRNSQLILHWMPQKTIDALGINRNILIGKRDGAGGYLVINYSTYMMENIIKKWVNCAYNPMCLTPPKASRNNSRFEQVALTALLYNDTKYSKLIGSFYTFNNHKEQCDHRKDCNMELKYMIINNHVLKCNSK